MEKRKTVGNQFPTVLAGTEKKLYDLRQLDRGKRNGSMTSSIIMVVELGKFESLFIHKLDKGDDHAYFEWIYLAVGQN